MRKICIIGGAPSAAEAPYDDKSWEIWGVSDRHDYVTRADRWFELHSLLTEDPDWADDWKKKLAKWTQDCELWDLKRFPVESIKQRFGTYFLTSTVAWMLALAIDEAVDEIELSGIDMEHKEEYRDQRAGVKHFIELAKFVGIKMHISGVNGILFDPVPYPMWQDDPQIMKIAWREKLMTKDLEELTAKKNEAEKRITELEAILMMWGHTEKALYIQLQEEQDSLYAAMPKLSLDVAGATGQLKATQWQRNQLKP